MPVPRQAGAFGSLPVPRPPRPVPTNLPVPRPPRPYIRRANVTQRLGAKIREHGAYGYALTPRSLPLYPLDAAVEEQR
eukprot:scaffold15742_cov71-Phaeocystis_antarctica.AAC.12